MPMSSPAATAAISIVNLRKSFGTKVVLDGISLDIAQGEIVAIMGSSGGGKTTLLRCVSGLIEATSGEVHVQGIDSRKDGEGARAQLGMVFQAAALFDFMDVGDNVRFGLKRRTKLSPAEREERVKEVLGLVGMEGTEDLLTSELSGGMQKRIGIARALALHPKVMLYDEPTTGLDPITTYTIDKLIVDLRESQGMTSLLVSHDVSSVFRTADRIAFLDDGRLTFIGKPKEFADSRDAAIRELVQKSEATSFSV